MIVKVEVSQGRRRHLWHRLRSLCRTEDPGKIFAIFNDGELIVKLPSSRADELTDSGRGRAWGPGTGRIMKGVGRGL